MKELPPQELFLNAMQQRKGKRDFNSVQNRSHRQIPWKPVHDTKPDFCSDAWSTALSPDGGVMASCHGDRTLKFWNVKTGERIKTLIHQQPIWACSFSPSGWGIATAGIDGMIWLWELETSRCFGKLQGHTGWIHTLDFSSIDDVIASGSTDTTVRLWNIATGKCLAVFEGHDRPVHTVEFDPTGHLLASISDDQVIKVWNIQTGECLSTLIGHYNNFADDMWALIN
ncbi:MAG: WD40 repeat domain-containing protein [Oculatellaceae cyanobacterium bins.114]|nr:WD40 repeat domain-containing protein [Oculatellaceae cyanobacterium bins.114]